MDHTCAITTDGKIAVTRDRGIVPQSGGRPVNRSRIKSWNTSTCKELASIPCNDRDGPAGVSGDGDTVVTGNPNRNGTIGVYQAQEDDEANSQLRV